MDAATTDAPPCRTWALVACIGIVGVHALFILSYWPGILGFDSIAVFSQIEGSNPHGSGKSAFWVYFVEALYTPAYRIESVTIALGALCSLVFCRICIYLLQKRHIKSLIFCVFFVFLAPHIIAMNIAIYPDGIFAVATAGLFFEIYICIQRRHIDKWSFALIATLSAFAIFSRSNGIANFIPLLAACVILRHRERNKSLALVGLNLAILVTLNITNKPASQDAMFPLALWETSNFLQPRGSQLPTNQGRVSLKTIEVLEQVAPLKLINEYHDPEYWDPLIFNPDGPQLGRLNNQQREIIIKEFLNHNVWHNFPQFAGSRVHVFLASAFASSGLPWPMFTKDIIHQTKTISQPSLFQSLNTTIYLNNIFIYTFKYRAFFWNALYGLLLIFYSVYFFNKLSIQKIISITYLLQAGGIFIFSIAAENRYLLCLTLAPLVLLPMLADARCAPNHCVKV